MRGETSWVCVNMVGGNWRFEFNGVGNSLRFHGHPDGSKSGESQVPGLISVDRARWGGVDID